MLVNSVLVLYVGGYSYISGLAFVQVWETRMARGVVTERGLSDTEKVSV
jgi:hypothetical protein